MSIRLYKSYTPGTRNRAITTFSEIYKTTEKKANR
jgi:ribosomal protein L2